MVAVSALSGDGMDQLMLSLSSLIMGAEGQIQALPESPKAAKVEVKPAAEQGTGKGKGCC